MPSWIQYSSENTGVGKIVLSCKLANYKDFQKVFFLFSKLAEVWLKDQETWKTTKPRKEE